MKSPNQSINSIRHLITDIFEKHRSLNDGKLPDYIPELLRANPAWFGIAITTVDGRQYLVGDYAIPFTIQSVSKPFVYGLALEEHGIEATSAKIDVEPSGEAFNSISLKAGTGQPRNPMINAGAIAATGLIPEKDGMERFDRIFKAFEDFAGQTLQVDESVYHSESETGFRNRAIGNMLRNFNIIEGEVDPILEAYFKQCSILVDSRSLSVMGATLANGGINPLTGKRVLSRGTVEKVTSVMSTCGMYDYSGNWAFEVGIPAKSGVGGGIVGVLPGQLSIAVFSPLLDKNYNSVRGIATFRDFAKSFGLHLLNQPSMTNYVLWRNYTLSENSSTRGRRKVLQAILQREGQRVRIFELQGDLHFAAFERVVHAYSLVVDETDRLILDLTRIGQIDEATHSVLIRFAKQAFEKGKRISLVDPKGIFSEAERRSLYPGAFVYNEANDALEDAEENLLAEGNLSKALTTGIALEDMDLLQDLRREDFEALRALTTEVSFAAGTRIIEQGTPPDEIYFLSSGLVGVVLRQPDTGATRQIQSLSPGLSFGELSFLQGTTRTADVVALKPVKAFALTRVGINHFRTHNAEGYQTLLHNSLSTLAGRLLRASREMASLK